MPMMMTRECRCCQKSARTGDMHHCRDCWEKYHNGLRDKDWLNREEWEKVNTNRPKPEDLEIVRQFRPMQAEVWKMLHEEENQVRKLVGKRQKQIKGDSDDQMERPQG